MIGISWTEMLIIGVFALIFIGPKELPALMQRLGKVVGTIRRMGGEFQRELNRTTGLDQVTDLRRSLTEPLKKTTAEIAKEFNRITPTGTEPSGVIKPADPKAQSVVSEIKAAAGMETPAATPAPNPSDSMKTAVEHAVAEKAPLKTGPTAPATKALPRKRGVTGKPAANGADAAARPARKRAAPRKAAPKAAADNAVEAAPVKTGPTRAKAPTRPRTRKPKAAVEPAAETPPAGAPGEKP
jgi:sec-independent protein translocase protein TatB